MKVARDPDAVRRAMKARDLTLREMGQLCHCSYQTIAFALEGRPVNTELARRMTRVLRGRLHELFEDAKSTSKRTDGDPEAVPA